MKFFNSLFKKEKEFEHKKTVDDIGETDCCPYCKKQLEKIPSRKSSCPYCKSFIYSRTRPYDRKKVLVTEKQREEIEEQWSRVHEEQEEQSLMENQEFVSAKKELTKQFGKEPSLSDVKWRVYNQNILTYASQRQWGLYRNNKLDMAFLLQKENRTKQALGTMFEVIFLDINGCRNMGLFDGNPISKKELDDLGIKEFDPKSGFLAPGVVGPIQDLIDELKFTETQAKDLFISTNKQTKPSKNMPVSEDKSWDILQKEIKIRKANEAKIQEFDAEDVDAIIQEIKKASKNKDTLSSIIYKFRDKYKNKNMIASNAEKIIKVISELLNSSETIKPLGVSLLLFFIKKDKDLFGSLAKEYIHKNKKHFEKCPEEHTIGEIGKIEPDWVKDLIPLMIKALKQNPEWNTRRFVAFNLGSIGSKHPKLIRDAIPIMIEYIKNPEEVTKRKPTRVEAKGIVIEMNLSAESMLGVDQTQWLKDAYIDSLCMIAQGSKELIYPHKALFEKIATKDKSEYSRKKAQKVLDILLQK